AHERSVTARNASDVARQRDEFETERRTFAARAEERMQQSLREFARELERRAAESGAQRARVTPAQSALLSRTLEEMRRDLGIKPEERTPEDDGALKPDDRVRVLSLSQDGTVVEDYGETVLVAIGPMKTVVKKSDVSRRGRSPVDRKR